VVTLCKVRREPPHTDRTLRDRGQPFPWAQAVPGAWRGGGHTLQSAPRLVLKFKWADSSSPEAISPRRPVTRPAQGGTYCHCGPPVRRP